MQFQRAAQALCDAGVEFVVIDGLAATLHGSAPVDICCSRASRQPAASFPGGLPFVRDEGTLRNGTVFTLKTDIGEIDLLAEVAGLSASDDVKQHSITVEAFERQIVTLDLPGLIRAKRATGREKDLTALAELESLLEAGEPQPYRPVGSRTESATDCGPWPQ